jgi:hypothetical protein
MLFAHHVEPQHYPILALFLAVGIYTGWSIVGRFFARAPKHD